MDMSLSAVGLFRPGALRLGRYLPLSMAVTVAVTVLPLVAVAQLRLTRTPMAVALYVVVAMALSMLVARVLAALWIRYGHSSDLVFGDLLIWGWVRRAFAERRLEAASRELANRPSTGDGHADLLRRMSALLEARDPYTHGHSRRVARHSERIARQLGLPPERVATIRAAALVHDIGKINVPRSLLTKPDRLTEQEFRLVRRHPGDGAAMVAVLGDSELTSTVRSHHERIDGTGYPDGLAGADIPLGARIIAVADTFDAITSTRPYRRPRTHRQALEVLRREAGTQLDADAVAAFGTYYGARRSVRWAALIVAAPQRLLAGFGGVSTGLGAGVAPLAQTACGVAAIALVGACLGGSAVPAAGVDGDAVTAAAPHDVLDHGRTASVERSSGPVRTQHRSGHSHPRRRAHVHGDGSTAQPDRVGTPLALRMPTGGSPGGSSGSAPSGSGAGSTGAVTDGVSQLTDSLPVGLPGAGDVVDSVSGQLPAVPTVPAVPAPVQVPSLTLP